MKETEIKGWSVQVEALKKELSKARVESSTRNQVDTMHTLLQRLDESERQNFRLKQEVAAQKQVVNTQGKALASLHSSVMARACVSFTLGVPSPQPLI